MELICFDRMSGHSKNCMMRRWNKKARTIKQAYHYRPRATLVYNLAFELGMSEEAVIKQIRNERLWLLRDIYGQDVITRADI